MTTTPEPFVELLPEGSTRTLKNTYDVASDHYGMYERLFEKYGDTARLTALNGDIIVTKRPEYIRAIFGHDPLELDPFASDSVKPIAGEGSLFCTRGQTHRTQRKMLMPSFHGARMRTYGRLMYDTASEMLWFGGKHEATLSTYPVMTAISMEVIIRAVFGITDPERILDLKDSLNLTMDAIHPSFIFSKALQRSFLGMGPWAKFQKAMARSEAIIYAEMARKREAGYGEDILSMMMQATDEAGEHWSDETIRDHLFTLLAAGHETTAISMTWCIYHIHKHPEVLARLRDEVDEAFEAGMELDEIAKLPYLNAVWKEAMRIYPILPDVLRQLNAPMELGPYKLDAGKVVGVSIIAVHRDPEIFPDPMAFTPERFLERTYKPWEFMPFGGGHRRCLGAAFASYEMAIVLATWIREADITLLDEEVKPARRGLTIATDKPVAIRVTRRHTHV